MKTSSLYYELDLVVLGLMSLDQNYQATSRTQSNVNRPWFGYRDRSLQGNPPMSSVHWFNLTQSWINTCRFTSVLYSSPGYPFPKFLLKKMVFDHFKYSPLSSIIAQKLLFRSGQSGYFLQHLDLTYFYTRNALIINNPCQSCVHQSTCIHNLG